MFGKQLQTKNAKHHTDLMGEPNSVGVTSVRSQHWSIRLCCVEKTLEVVVDHREDLEKNRGLMFSKRERETFRAIWSLMRAETLSLKPWVVLV